MKEINLAHGVVVVVGVGVMSSKKCRMRIRERDVEKKERRDVGRSCQLNNGGRRTCKVTVSSTCKELKSKVNEW